MGCEGDPAHIELERSLLLSGRYINERDVLDARKVAVIGPNVVEDLFGKGDPLGAFIRINAVTFQVIGTFEDPGSRWENRVAYIPFSTAQQLYRTDGKIDRLVQHRGHADRSDSVTE